MAGYIKTDKALVKLKSIFIGDSSSKAKKIKKAYIGDDNNKARLIWSGGDGGIESLSYIGTTTSLSASRAYMGAASNGNRLYFAGGSTADESEYGMVSCTGVVDSYNENLTHESVDRITARTKMGSASINGNAVFAGGQTPGRRRFTDVVEAYDSNNTLSTKSSLSIARGDLAGGATESYAYFGGGHYMSGSDYICVRDVDVYDNNITFKEAIKFAGTVNKSARSSIASVSTSEYVLFAGGRFWQWEDLEPEDPHEWSYRSNVDVFNDSGQYLTSFNLKERRSGIAGACAGEYIILRGGYRNSGYSNYTEYYYNALEIIDSNLTLIAAGLTERYVCESSGTSLGKCAIFAGGFGRIGDEGGFTEYPDIDAVDEESISLLIGDGKSKSVNYSLSEARSSMASGSIGNYALFAGGIISNEGYSKIVDVVKIE